MSRRLSHSDYFADRQSEYELCRDFPADEVFIDGLHAMQTHFMRRGMAIDKPSPAAVLRFLTETCGISCASEPSALCTLLGRMFKNEYDKEVFFDVEDYF